MKQNLATSEVWAERLSKDYGVEITAKEVRLRLIRAGRKGKDARTWLGDILRGVLFSEKEVRMACRDLLKGKEK